MPALMLLLALLSLESPACASTPCIESQAQSQVEESTGTPRCAPPTADNHYAMVAHADAADMWVAIGFPNADEAVAAAKAACSRAMDAGCILKTASFNGSFAIGRGATGKLYYGTGATVVGAGHNLLKKCSESGDVCAELSHGIAKPATKTSGSDYRFARSTWLPTGHFRHVFASAAQAEPTDAGSQKDVWIATGLHNAQEAEYAAVDACSRESGFKCASVRTVASTYLYVWQTDQGEVRVGSSPIEKLVEAIVQSDCPKTEKCRFSGVFNPWNARVVRHRAHHSSQE